MKQLTALLFIFCFFRSHAQDAKTSPLFKKGVILEYKTLSPRPRGFSAKPALFESTRLTYVVDDVKDSNNVLYSYITKTGTHPDDNSLHFTKKYVLSSEGGKLSLPFDFYAIDTLYFSNMYPTQPLVLCFSAGV